MPGRRWLTSDFNGFSKCPPKRILTAYNIPLQLPTVTWRDTGLRAPPRKRASRLHEAFEAAIDHPLGVEWQRLGVHHAGQPLVGHHLGVDAVALRATCR